MSETGKGGFSFPDRDGLWRNWRSGEEDSWDVIVVGGGITGAGILHEAVRRGYRTLLLEQRDFAWGTSSRSSKMVHGGIRYLASGQVSLTRHALQEREKLISEAPRLVKRLGYYYPLYRGRFPPRFMASALFWLYDRLAGIRDHRRLGNPELAQVFPQLDTSRLNGAFYYTDAVTDDARLTLRVLQESVQAGGTVRNYSRVVELRRDDGRINGLRVDDLENGQQIELNCRMVLNATGAWADRLGGATPGELHIRPQRGSHLVLPADRFPLEHAIFLEHPADQRRVFVYPWEGRTVVGTTDIHHADDLNTAASITGAELDYLLAAAAPLFSRQPPKASDVIASWSGVRPIIVSGSAGNASAASREHRVWSEPGMVSCSGGKLTTFHHMARDVLDQAAEDLPPRREAESERIFRLHGLDGADILPGDPDLGERLLGRYGEAARTLIADAPEDEHVPIPGTRTCLAQLRWALGRESVVHLDDLMLRRTRLGLLLEDGGATVLDRVREIAAEVRGWDEAHWARERARYLGVIRKYYAVPGKES